MRSIQAMCLLFVLTGVMCFVPGCSRHKTPTLKPESARVTSVTQEGVQFHVTLSVFNPNSFDMNTLKTSGTVKLGSTVTLGPISKPHGVKLPAGRYTSVAVDIEAPWTQAASLAILIASGPTIPYEVEGTITIGSPKLNVDLPFKITGEMTQAELISSGVKGLPKIPGLPSPQGGPTMPGLPILPRPPAMQNGRPETPGEAPEQAQPPNL